MTCTLDPTGLLLHIEALRRIRRWTKCYDWYDLKWGGKTSDELTLLFSQDSDPITTSACVEAIMFSSCAFFPGLFMDWQLIIRTLSGKS
ncbi:hypothetical protein DPMN_122053 [Dreissena polymorpha]|uniref:Uncharacterized protein n=1 Tax=Dreissena polymorpha TaxID=45954 RepID=A0A9D4GUR0_DREPO|nr:hypothetical protein DPMN_122053 [Dreissena polymorpha]